MSSSRDQMKRAAEERRRLLGQESQENAAALVKTLSGDLPVKGVSMRIPVGKIKRSPYQPRLLFSTDELNALADDIEAHGLRQPIEVRQVQGGYELIDGERRLQAHEWRQRLEIDAFVLAIDDIKAAALVTLANLFRANLVDFEKARAAQTLIQTGAASSQADAARQMHVSKMTVSRLMEFFSLPDSVLNILKLYPDLIGSTYTRKIVALCETKQGEHAVLQAFEKAASGEIGKNGSIVRYAENLLNSAPTPRQIFSPSGFTIATISTSGRKLSVNLDPQVDPLKAAEAIELALRGVELLPSKRP